MRASPSTIRCVAPSVSSQVSAPSICRCPSIRIGKGGPVGAVFALPFCSSARSGLPLARGASRCRSGTCTSPVLQSTVSVASASGASARGWACQPGPHVLINALTHGNEICGMVAATHLLDTGVRPRIGTLTISFANVAAYASFDPTRPFESRQLVHNLNRIWSAGELDGTAASPELDRARALRPVVAAADHILDIHSTSQDVQPFWVYPAYPRNAQVA